MKNITLALIFMWIGISIFIGISLDTKIKQKDQQIIELQTEIEQLKSKPKIPTTVFTITRNNMQVVSSLGSEQDTIIKHHHYQLKDGVNSDYVVLQEGQSFEWTIINY